MAGNRNRPAAAGVSPVTAAGASPVTAAAALVAATATELVAAGCVAAEEEAQALVAWAAGDMARLRAALERRRHGEPLAWILGSTEFCGLDMAIAPGVYVPRWQSEALAERAATLLPAAGTAVDLGTGSGAVAAVLAHRRPRARVVGTEPDPVAAACARRNGVDVVSGPLFAGVAPSWRGRVDVVVGVLPYVPTEALHLLARDVLAFEPIGALDGGARGTGVLELAVEESILWLRPGGVLLIELGGDQAALLEPTLERVGFVDRRALRDDDNDVRGLEAWAATDRRAT